jgi:hypothetical protein
VASTVVELFHHKTERFAARPTVFTLPQSLATATAKYCRYARPVLLQYSHSEDDPGTLFLSPKGVSYDENSVTVGNSWSRIQKLYKAPWKPFPARHFRHIYSTTAWGDVVREVAEKQAPLAGDARIMGNSIRTWGSHYIRDRETMLGQAAISRLAAWRREQRQKEQVRPDPTRQAAMEQSGGAPPLSVSRPPINPVVPGIGAETAISGGGNLASSAGVAAAVGLAGAAGAVRDTTGATGLPLRASARPPTAPRMSGAAATVAEVAGQVLIRRRPMATARQVEPLQELKPLLQPQRLQEHAELSQPPPLQKKKRLVAGADEEGALGPAAGLKQQQERRPVQKRRRHCSLLDIECDELSQSSGASDTPDEYGSEDCDGFEGGAVSMKDESDGEGAAVCSEDAGGSASGSDIDVGVEDVGQERSSGKNKGPTPQWYEDEGMWFED